MPEYRAWRFTFINVATGDQTSICAFGKTRREAGRKIIPDMNADGWQFVHAELVYD